MIVYIPVEPNKKKMILENGINIEKDYNKKIGLRGVYVKCISGFLTPGHIPADWVATNVDTQRTYIANHDLWLAYKLSKNEIFNKMYIESIVNTKKYRFGEYRNPEILILSSVKKEDIVDVKETIGLCDKILFQCDRIYIDCLVEKIFQNTNVAKHIIVDYFTKLSLQNNDFTAQVVEKEGSKLYVFIDRKEESAWTVEI
ncbi:hypothetical protein B0S90_0489 [Caldicellulosiruptor bescii]|nr:hypothetical protein [Caldicellulosiruptor bescii]PBC88172.1 hypothetical protein B0S87_1136 [Caldicellulosiruptor bescii]PBC92347.1 hypothetical protein B0S89_2857 [Caldicellulosiruptor bescii]PBD04842.1 hypothetical protein B0S85_2551 [Caldicellulosiruptor bescii]PBD05528.1 hypothetical protein B0S90_0489 [Caldicellulosiruptor bescii]PBD08092.1 hypothetical protein B0S84_0391 [Caldicellulosiruptor bescii]